MTRSSSPYELTDRFDHEERAKLRGRTEDVSGIVRAVKPKSYGVWFGDEEEIQDQRTGELRKRQIWVWLPRKMTVRGDVSDPDVTTGKVETLTIPEWLAKDKGLI